MDSAHPGPVTETLPMTHITATPAPHPETRLAAITETIAQAFATDPTWAPMLSPDVSDLAVARRYWDFFVSTAQRYPWTFTIAGEAGSGATDTTAATDDVAATTVWYPPGSDELTQAEQEAFPEFAAELLGTQKRDELLEKSDLFEAAHPTEPHYYLSLLATNPAYSGRGLGMGLLAANLEVIDRLGMPSYLESSNPANDRRYMALGYEQHGTIALPTGLTLNTFWREPAAH